MPGAGLFCVASERLLDDIPLADIRDFTNNLLAHLEQNQSQLIQEIQSTGKLSDEAKADLLATTEAYKKQVK